MNWALVVAITYGGLLGFCVGCIFMASFVVWMSCDPDAD